MMLQNQMEAELRALTCPRQALSQCIAEEQTTFLRAVQMRLSYARGLASQIQIRALESAINTVLESNERIIDQCATRAGDMEREIRRWEDENRRIIEAIERAKLALPAPGTVATAESAAAMETLLRLYARRATVCQAMVDGNEEISRLRRQVWRVQEESLAMLEAVVEKLTGPQRGLTPPEADVRLHTTTDTDRSDLSTRIGNTTQDGDKSLAA